MLAKYAYYIRLLIVFSCFAILYPVVNFDTASIYHESLFLITCRLLAFSAFVSYIAEALAHEGSIARYAKALLLAWFIRILLIVPEYYAFTFSITHFAGEMLLRDVIFGMTYILCGVLLTYNVRKSNSQGNE